MCGDEKDELILERLRITFKANGKRQNDHVTMFILNLPLAVFSFSVKSSGFALASKARIIQTIFTFVLFISRKRKCETHVCHLRKRDS